jgi:hypothetical protein
MIGRHPVSDHPDHRVRRRSSDPTSPHLWSCCEWRLNSHINVRCPSAVDENRPGWIPFEWEEMHLDVMEALGRKDEAQGFRWQCFERALNSAHLSAYLKRLPDFEDLEAEERAMSHALRFPSVPGVGIPGVLARPR